MNREEAIKILDTLERRRLKYSNETDGAFAMTLTDEELEAREFINKRIDENG